MQILQGNQQKMPNVPAYSHGQSGMAAAKTCAPKKKPSKTWKKPKGMPKRPLSAYNLFFAEERRRAIVEKRKLQGCEDQLGSDDGRALRLGFANLTRRVASKWKVLSEEDKAPFLKIAAKEKTRYQEELKVWRAVREGEVRKQLLANQQQLQNEDQKSSLVAHSLQDFDKELQQQRDLINSTMGPISRMTSFEAASCILVSNSAVRCDNDKSVVSTESGVWGDATLGCHRIQQDASGILHSQMELPSEKMEPLMLQPTLGVEEKLAAPLIAPTMFGRTVTEPDILLRDSTMNDNTFKPDNLTLLDAFDLDVAAIWDPYPVGEVKKLWANRYEENRRECFDKLQSSLDEDQLNLLQKFAESVEAETQVTKRL